MSQRVNLRRAAWHGDRPFILDFPAHWEVVECGPPPLPALAPEAISACLQRSCGTPPLAELAAGRRNAVILVDDLSRPTPVQSLLPPLLTELARAGLAESQITIVIAGGSHAPESVVDIERKLGSALAGRLRVVAHDCRRDLVALGRSPSGIPVWVNRFVMEADLKIGVGAIYPHPAAGYSGGAKILAPAACGLETIQRLHDDLRPARQRGGALNTELRIELEAIAEQAGLSFIVNAVLNADRQIAAVFAGHPVRAHRAGIAFLEAHYRVALTPEADVVVADMYPFDLNLQFAHDRGLWPLEGRRPKVSKVMVAACPCGVGSHTLYPVTAALTTRLTRRLQKFRLTVLRDLPVRLKFAFDLMTRGSLDLLVLSQGLEANALRGVFPRARLFREWETLRGALQARHPGPATVALYRSAPLCLPPAETR